MILIERVVYRRDIALPERVVQRVVDLGDGDAEKAGSILRRLPGIDANYANACLTKALTWANNLARESC